MNKLILVLLIFAPGILRSQVTSIYPANAVNGQTLLTIITLNSVPLTVASPPMNINDIYLQKGNEVIYANSFSVYYSPPGYADTLSVTFTIPQLAPTGLYDVHVFRYINNPFPQPPTPIDNVLSNVFFIGLYGGTISGNVYFDSNQNGSRDAGEQGIPNIQLILSPAGTTVLTESSGYYSVKVDSGNYDLSLNALGIYTPTTPSTINAISLPPDSFGNDFGLFSNASNLYAQDFSIGTHPMRCSSLGFSSWNIINQTNEVQNGTITLIHSPNLLFNSATVPPSVQGNTLRWTYQLTPFESLQSNIYYTNPAAGDTVSYIVLDSIFDVSGSFQVLHADTFSFVVSCSVNPNNKVVTPAGIDSPHFTLNNTELVYTINFQNTGPDTANNIVLTDTVDANLDLSTLQILGFSSPVHVEWDANGVMQFRFDNILLPDSTSDELRSHGYVIYSIHPYSNVPDSSVIRNTAYINFDLNTGIATNTTYNTLVSHLPNTGIKTINVTGGSFVFPNPVSESSVLFVPYDKTYELRVFNAMGQIVLVKNTSGNYILEKDNFSPGIYHYQMIEKYGNRNYTGRFVVVD